MKEPGKDNADDAENLNTIKHDIKNQLSNIQLAAEQLRYEVENPPPDYTFYLDMIAKSCAKIAELVNAQGQ